MTAALARIDSSLYLRMPRVNAYSGISLARAILIALPKSPPAGVRHAAREMRAHAVTLQSAQSTQREVAASAPTRTTREVDNEADALHGAMRRRLGDYDALATRSPELAQRARALSAVLYPKGSDITKGNVQTQWQRTEVWFETLAKEGREAALRELVGDAFVDALKATHVEYGEVIGTTKARRVASPRVDVAKPLAALLTSMQDLALQLVAVANDGSAEEAVRIAARQALVPIDALRDANTRRDVRRASNDEPTPSPDGPLPDVR